MPAIVVGLLTGVILGVVGAVTSLARKRDGDAGTGVAVNFALNIAVGLAVIWPSYALFRPTTTFAGLLPLFLFAVFAAFLIACIGDGVAGGVSAAPFVTLIAVAALGVSWLAVHNGPHDAQKAAFGIVHVTTEPGDALPASSTSDLVALTPDQAATKASQAMSSGLSASRNYATFTNPGPATLERVNGKMEYVFTLEFDGAGNKARLHAIIPGYIMIDAEDTSPQARPVERYDGQYSMIVSLGGGQGSEPLRWARDHGYSKYLLDDPTLEIQDGTGIPFYTVTLVTPHLGSTFMAPSGVLLINAHTGQITRYDLPGRGKNPAPVWIDRVFSSDMAMRIANWYGKYGQAGWGGAGSSNANRFQVSDTPVLTYTGDENPSWRMQLTSFNNDTAVYRIIEMDSATGAIRVYHPAGPMGIESSVAQAFCNAQGLGAGNVRSNHLLPEHLSLHVIDGTLVWMTSYESSQNNGATDASAPDQQEGDTGDPCGNGEAPAANPTFTGIGFVPAYAATASNAVFGNTRAAALENLFQSLAAQGNGQGNAPGAGATEVTITGTIADNPQHTVPWDVSGGTKNYYITLDGANGKPDPTRVYIGTSAAGAGLVLAEPGDHVTIKVLTVTKGAGQQQIQSFSDQQHPLANAGA